jgi:hypothetical protein
MLMFAVLARERSRRFRLLLLPFLFCFASAHSSAASAASLTVKIRQVNPDGAVQQATCADHKKCLLPVAIQTSSAQKETLSVSIEFVPGNVLLEFQSPKGYLYTGSKTPADKNHGFYEIIWHKAVAPNKPVTSDITLFLPAVPHAEVAPMLNVAQQPVADLEITTEATP